MTNLAGLPLLKAMMDGMEKKKANRKELTELEDKCGARFLS